MLSAMLDYKHLWLHYYINLWLSEIPSVEFSVVSALAEIEGNTTVRC